uniref:EF-hand domain-containing protein n=1 Tax=Strongyloides venezuelensis TaxID=75913 RepID=A0A0K0G5B9_STRVS
MDNTGNLFMDDKSLLQLLKQIRLDGEHVVFEKFIESIGVVKSIERLGSGNSTSHKFKESKVTQDENKEESNKKIKKAFEAVNDYNKIPEKGFLN